MSVNNVWYISGDTDKIRVKLERDYVGIVEVMPDGTEVNNGIEMDYEWFVRPPLKRTKIEIADELFKRFDGPEFYFLPETAALIEEYKNADE